MTYVSRYFATDCESSQSTAKSSCFATDCESIAKSPLPQFATDCESTAKSGGFAAILGAILRTVSDPNSELIPDRFLTGSFDQVPDADKSHL